MWLASLFGKVGKLLEAAIKKAQLLTKVVYLQSSNPTSPRGRHNHDPQIRHSPDAEDNPPERDVDDPSAPPETDVDVPVPPETDVDVSVPPERDVDVAGPVSERIKQLVLISGDDLVMLQDISPKVEQTAFGTETPQRHGKSSAM